MGSRKLPFHTGAYFITAPTWNLGAHALGPPNDALARGEALGLMLGDG